MTAHYIAKTKKWINLLLVVFLSLATANYTSPSKTVLASTPNSLVMDNWSKPGVLIANIDRQWPSVDGVEADITIKNPLSLWQRLDLSNSGSFVITGKTFVDDGFLNANLMPPNGELHFHVRVAQSDQVLSFIESNGFGVSTGINIVYVFLVLVPGVKSAATGDWLRALNDIKTLESLVQLAGAKQDLTDIFSGKVSMLAVPQKAISMSNNVWDAFSRVPDDTKASLFARILADLGVSDPQTNATTLVNKIGNWLTVLSLCQTIADNIVLMVVTFDTGGRSQIDFFSRYLSGGPIPPVAPVIVGPRDVTVSTLRPTFDWNTVPNATNYILNISPSPDFNISTLHYRTSAPPFVFPVDLAASRTYFWKVLALNQAGTSPYSSAVQFQTPSGPPPPGLPTDTATFIADVTYPDYSVLSPGQSFNKTWRLENTGTSTWNGFTLTFVNGNQMGGPASVAVGTTSPGQTVDITVPLVAPSGGGTYQGSWQLKDNQGVDVSGGFVRVRIRVITNTQTGHITLFDLTPASPSSSSNIHLVGRIRYFPEFRAMRFVMGTDKEEMPNYRQVGDQLEISTDWNTSSLARGTYALAVEVATKSDPNWTSAERQIKTYTLTGTPAPAGRPPDRPVLKEPYDWYVRDASGSSASVQLCVYPSSDPDGGTVQYLFQVLNQIGDPVQNSGWITSTCYNPTLSPGIYGWKVQAGNDNGALASDWSLETWHFSVASGEVAIGDISFRTYDSDQKHMCVNVTFGGTIAPDVYAWLNRQPDGSENGEWRLLDHFGPNAEDCSDSAQQHGLRIYPREYETGNHAVKITAIKRDSNHNQVASATKGSSYDIAYLRPSNFQAVAPSTSDNNGTFWNSLTQTFQWTRSLRDDQGYELRVSTSSDIWNDSAPLARAILPSGTISHTHTFTQDYAKLYWSVKAINSAGSTDFGTALWFGIDRVAPTSAVQALPSTTYESVFQVNWNSSDNPAGIRSFDIQYMDSGRGTWNNWLTGVPASKTYDLFTGEPGHTYYFRSRATDNANNTGNYPASANTSVKVDPSTRPPTPWWNSAYGSKRNVTILNNMSSVTMPVGYPVRLHFDSATTPSASDLYNASQSSPKCNDLRIIYNDTTELDRLVESCSSSAIDIRFRTQVSISGGASDNTRHQLYYGNSAATNPPADQRNVWPPPNDGNTVGVWYLSEGSGSASADLSGRGNNITSIGATNWCDGGKFGQALCTMAIDVGPDGAFIPGNSSLSSNAFTFEAFVKLGSMTYYATIAAQGESNNAQERWSLYLQEGKLVFGLWHPNGGGSVRTDSAALPDTNWHHLAVTFDGCSTVKLYVDGALVKTGSMPNCGIINNNFDLYVGSGFKPYGGRNFLGTVDQVRFSNIVRTSFPYAAIATITSEPSVATGSPIAPPVTGSPDLALLSLTTYPNPSGGVLAQAVIQNQGNLSTQNGFWIDLYQDHLPTGTGDLTGSVRYWVASPIEAGATITLTTAITSAVSLSGISLQSVSPASEITATLYAQVDSTGAVSETNKLNNISTGSQVCVASADTSESDDTVANASTITIDGIPQLHNFSAPGDQDWVSFTATTGVTYTIRTTSLDQNADTVLWLYGPDGTTLLASNDDYNGLASQITWEAPGNGTYYIKVTGWNPNVGGCGTNYDLSMRPTGYPYHLYLPVVAKSYSGGW